MEFVLWILWALMWGGAGYFTVRAIRMRIERKRAAKAMAVRRYLAGANITPYTDSEGNKLYSVFPLLTDLSKTEDLE